LVTSKILLIFYHIILFSPNDLGGLFGIKIKLFSVNMTLFTVVCYDFVVFSRSKSRIFENSTLSPCGYFSEIPARKTNLIFLFRPFYVRLETPRRKNKIYPIVAGTNVLSSAKPGLSRILTETL